MADADGNMDEVVDVDSLYQLQYRLIKLKGCVGYLVLTVLFNSNFIRGNIIVPFARPVFFYLLFVI